jgi:dTDP-4-dehydrorhamnose reductase
MAIEVARYLEFDEQLITPVDATTFTQPGMRPQRTGFHIKKAMDELGYKPTDFRIALAEIFG